MNGEFVKMLLRLTGLLNVSIEYSRVRKLVQDDEIKFLYEAKIINKSLRTIGVGSSTRNSRQDVARKMLFIVLRNNMSGILNALQPEKNEDEPPRLKTVTSDGS